MRHRIRHAVMAAVLTTTGACATTEPDPGLEATQAIIVPGGGGCAGFGCGTNSPVIDAFELHELSLNPYERNAEGFALEVANGAPQIVHGGVGFELRVAGGRIQGFARGKQVLGGPALVEAWIPVRRGKTRYAIVIRTVRELSYFIAPFDPVEAYTLEWYRLNGDTPATNLCNNVAELQAQQEVDPEGTARELMGLAVGEAVVFEGDRVDAAAMTMAKAADDRWFNLGCAGHTLSKLRLTHNTVHGQAPGMPRAWEARQATLKMLVADYCGDGSVFTVAGQPLSWQGDGMVYWRTPQTFEARWTEVGATCLYAPRMLTPTPLGKATFPDIWKALAQASCQPAKCQNRDLADYDGADRVSGNP